MKNYRQIIKRRRKYKQFVQINKKIILVIILLLFSIYLHGLNENKQEAEYKEYLLTDNELFLFPSEGLITAIDKEGSHENSKAVDIANNEGTPIIAAMEGSVSFTGIKDGYGNCIILNHNDDYSTLYAHLSRSLVKEGQLIKRGEKIGLMGSTGNSTGPHLHFEVRNKEERENILKFFPFLETNLYVTTKKDSLTTGGK